MMLRKEMEKFDFEAINRDNLLHGRDSYGGDMPPYSVLFNDGRQLYRDYKLSANPKNRGFWDLKHWWNKQYDGLFYGSIKSFVRDNKLVFVSNYNPKIMNRIYKIKPKEQILGITDEQFRKAVQEIERKNFEKLKASINV